MMVAWAVVLLAILLIGVTKSGFGSGVGLMIVPMAVMGLSHTPHGGEAALGLLLPLLIAGDLIAVWQYRRMFSIAIVKGLFPGTAAGVLLGGGLLWWFGRQHEQVAAALIRLEIGFESVLLVALHWWRVSRGGDLHVTPTPLRNAVTGIAAGASSTLAHAAGPIIALYLLPQNLDRRVFVGTCAIYFFLLNTSKLPAYAASGQFNPSTLMLSLWTLPLVLLGAAFGFWLNRHLTDASFSRAVYVLTFVLGWYLLVDGGSALMTAVQM